MRVKDCIGRFGEQLAAQYLGAAGLVIVDRNWRCRDGEIDLVARDGDVLAFVEVKTRSSTAFGDPAEAITAQKAARLRRLAVRWLADQRAGADGFAAAMRPWSEIRFDVVAVIRCAPGGPVVRHVKAAF